MAALLPCPCCGDPPDERPYNYDVDDHGNKGQMGVVFCRGCGLCMETCCGQAEAVARWNTRTELQPRTNVSGEEEADATVSRSI